MSFSLFNTLFLRTNTNPLYLLSMQRLIHIYRGHLKKEQFVFFLGYHAETHRVHEVMKTVESEMDRLGLDEKVCTAVCLSQLLFALNYCTCPQLLFALN